YRTLAAHGGRILLLGVDHTRNTTIHAAEFLAGLPHISGPGYAAVRDDRLTHGYHIETIAREPDCSLGFDGLNDLLPRRSRQIGGCLAWLLDSREVISRTLALLRRWPAALPAVAPTPTPLPAQVQTTNPKIGVHTRLTDEADPAKIRESLRLVREMGAPWVTEYFPWVYIQPSDAAHFDWQHADAVVD